MVLIKVSGTQGHDTKQKTVQTFPVLSGMTNSRAAFNLNITLGIANGSTPLPGRGLEV